MLTSEFPVAPRTVPSAPVLPHAGFFNLSDQLVREIQRRQYLTFVLEVDAAGLDARRRAARQAGRPVPSYTSYVVAAVAQALREHPHLNCMIRECPFARGLVPLGEIRAVVAVERRVGETDMVLAVPIRDADAKPQEVLHEELRHMSEDHVLDHPCVRDFLKLAALARHMPFLAGWLIRLPRFSKRWWMKFGGGSFVVTSPGKYGGPDAIMVAWPWPLTVAFGRIKPRPMVVDGQVVARNTLLLTLAADRRLANGAPLSRFAERMRELIGAAL